MNKFTNFNQAKLLKVAAVAIAIPRYAGAFALSAGFTATGWLHTGFIGAEILAGVAMAVLEGFALAFILSKWRLLKAYSIEWWSLAIVSLLLALSLPLVAVPYLYFTQAGYSSVNEVFPHVAIQNTWNFIVAFVPMLIVIGVGLADVDELEREQKGVDFELEVSKKRAMLEVELSKLKLEVEQARAANELQMSKLQLDIEQTRVVNELETRKLRASFKLAASNVDAVAQQNLNLPFVCEYCGEAYEQERQLRGHKGHCKGRVNGEVKLLSEASTNGHSSDEVTL